MTTPTYQLDTNLTLGLEVEFTNEIGLSAHTFQRRVGEKIVELTGWSPDYSYRRITDGQGRVWSIVNDPSVSGGGGEMVAPVMTIDDLAEDGPLHTVIKALRAAKAIPHTSAGIHCHIGLTNRAGVTMTPRQIVNTLAITHNLDNFLGEVAMRRNSWCPEVPTSMVERMKKFGSRVTMDDLGSVFYAYDHGNLRTYAVDATGLNRRWRQHSRSQYDAARYLGCNLHNLWFRRGNRRTIEFRLFATRNHRQRNGKFGFHFGKIKSYLHLCMGIISKAKRVSRTTLRRKEIRPNEAKYQFRTACIHLGLIGDEYKATRKHLMGHFGGAYRGERRAPVAVDRDFDADVVAARLAEAQGCPSTRRVEAIMTADVLANRRRITGLDNPTDAQVLRSATIAAMART